MKHFAMPAFVVPFEFIKPELLIKPRVDKDEHDNTDDLKTEVRKRNDCNG